MDPNNRFSNTLITSSKNDNLFIFSLKLLIGYFSFIAYVKSIEKPIFSLHDNFFNKPEVILMAGIAIVYQSTGSFAISIYTLLFYYVTTIAQNNVKETYDKAFGIFSPFFFKLSKAMGFYKNEINLGKDLREDSDSDSDTDSDIDSDIDSDNDSDISYNLN